MQEIKEVRQLLTEWQKDNKISGKLQNVIAEVLGTNKTKVGTLEHIDGKLIEPFKMSLQQERSAPTQQTK